MITLLDRYIATFWGHHIGDAIWAPLETKPAACIPALLGPSGLVFKSYTYDEPWPEWYDGRTWPAGRPTDDSDQAADLCHSLLACDGIDKHHLRIALQQSAIHGESRLWRGLATGIGSTTKAMLGSDQTAYEAAMKNPYASNGSLMRSPPMALFQGPTPQKYPIPNGAEYEMVKLMSQATHVHPDSIAACWLYVRMLRNALANRDIADVKAVNTFDRRILKYMCDVEAGHGLPEDPGSFANGWGSAEYSLKVALHTVLTTSSFEECIRTVGLAGGDTDTYGAIAGALAGAVYGTREIPRQWRNTILGKDVLLNYATQLHERYLKITD